MNPTRVRSRMGVWPGAQFEIIDGARHEVLMETPDTRRRIFDRVARFMDAHSGENGTRARASAAGS